MDVFRHQLPEEVTRYYLRQGGVECQDDTTCVPCHRSFRADQAESENAPIKPIKRTHDIECPLDDDRRLLPAPLRRPPPRPGSLKLVSLATDKFIADIVHDAVQFRRLRQLREPPPSGSAEVRPTHRSCPLEAVAATPSRARRSPIARLRRARGLRSPHRAPLPPPRLFKRARARFARTLARGEADEKESFTLELADIAMSLSQRGVNVLTPRSESA